MTKKDAATQPVHKRRSTAGLSTELPQNQEFASRDQSPEERIEADYIQRLNALIDDANANGTMEILVNGLTWSLARVIVYLDSAAVTGDVLRMLGHHVFTVAAKRVAQRELDEARARGISAN